MVKRRKKTNKKKWFKPKKHTGWQKTQNATTRRRKLLASTPKRMNMKDRYVQAGRRANALANVTKDDRTGKLARQDADYFFDKASKL